jgi:cell wall assembly regulator SMI1
MDLGAEFSNLCTEGEISGPCGEEAIEKAEVALGVRFPDQYRHFLTNFGSMLACGIEIYGLPDPTKNDPPLWQDVVAVTKQLRDWEQAGSENLAYVPIADDGTGVYFFLDTGEAPNTKVVAVGAGVEADVSTDLFKFAVDLSQGKIAF